MNNPELSTQDLEQEIISLTRDLTTEDISSRNEEIIAFLNDEVRLNFFKALEVLKRAQESGHITDEDFQQRIQKLDLLSNESLGHAISSLAIDRYNQDNLPYIIKKENYELKQTIESEYTIGCFKFFNGKLYYSEEVDDDFTDLIIAQENNTGELERKQTLKINDKSGIKYFGFWNNKAILVDAYNAMEVNLETGSSEGSELLKWDLLKHDQEIASAQLLPNSRLAVGTQDGKIIIYDLENKEKKPIELNLGENPISSLSVYKNTLFAAEGKNRDHRFRDYKTFKVDLNLPNLTAEMIFERPENCQENIQAVNEETYFYTSAGFASICRKEDENQRWSSREWARGDTAPIKQYKTLLMGEKFLRIDKKEKYNLTYFDRSGEYLLSEKFDDEVKQVQIIPDGRIFVLSGYKIFIYDGEVKDE